jgi:hypothetical protein
MLVRTKSCPTCGESSVLIVPEEGYQRWMEGESIQEALPTLAQAQREQLMTGIHGDCWKRIFADDFNSDDYEEE